MKLFVGKTVWVAGADLYEIGTCCCYDMKPTLTKVYSVKTFGTHDSPFPIYILDCGLLSLEDGTIYRSPEHYKIFDNEKDCYAWYGEHCRELSVTVAQRKKAIIKQYNEAIKQYENEAIQWNAKALDLQEVK